MAKKKVLVARVLVVLVLVLVASFLLGVQSALAQDAESLEISIEVQDDGGWDLKSFAGLDLGVSSKSFGALAKLLSMDMSTPAVPPEVVKIAAENDIKSLVLVKEGSQTTILINNEPLSAITIAEPAMAALVAADADLQALVEGLVGGAGVTLVVQFPSAAGTAVDLSARLGGAQASAPANTIDIASTMSPRGELLSVGGMALSQLGLGPITVDMSMAQQLGVQNLDAKLAGSGLSLNVNEQEWVKVDWDIALLKAKGLPLYANMSGGALPEGTDQVVDVATSWLGESQISFRTGFGEGAQEAAPSIKLARPVMVEFGADSSLKVEGIAVPAQVDISPYRDLLQSAALTWKGDERKLYVLVNDQQMPYVELEAGFLTSAAPAMNMDAALLGQADATLQNSGLTLIALTEAGSKPDLAGLDYQAKPPKRWAGAVPKLTVSREDGSVALFGATLPLDILEGLFGIPVKAPVQQAVSQMQGIDAATVAMSPAGVRVSLNNGGNARLHWDDRLRDNLVNLAIKYLESEAAKQAGIYLPVKGRTIRGVLGLVNNFEVGADVILQDEALGGGFLAGK